MRLWRLRDTPQPAAPGAAGRAASPYSRKGVSAPSSRGGKRWVTDLGLAPLLERFRSQIILFMFMFAAHRPCIPNLPTSKHSLIVQLPDSSHELDCFSLHPSPIYFVTSMYAQGGRAASMILPGSGVPCITTPLHSDR